MSDISKSATKLVLLGLVATLCFAIAFGIVTRQVDYKDIIILFVGVVSSVTGFYFANKGDNSKDYLGK